MITLLHRRGVAGCLCILLLAACAEPTALPGARLPTDTPALTTSATQTLPPTRVLTASLSALQLARPNAGPAP